MRASNADAAMYYLARMIDAGEDPGFIARRRMIFASEDIGLAQPTALILQRMLWSARQYIVFSLEAFPGNGAHCGASQHLARRCG